MKRLREIFKEVGYRGSPDEIDAEIAGGRMPRPGVRDKGVRVAEILDTVDRGYRQFVNDLDFGAAVTTVQGAIRQIDRNPALAVQDTGTQQSVIKAYIALALSFKKLGRADDASAAMSELCRILGAAPTLRDEHGPAADEFARNTCKRLAAPGRGDLSITTGNPKALIFVNRQYSGLGQITLKRLLPGTYRILVQEPQTIGVQYWVEVRANKLSRLDVDLAIDSLLIVTDTSVGVTFANDQDRSREGGRLGSVVRRWTDRPLFATFGTAQELDRLVVVGTLYRANGEPINRAYLPADDVLDDARLRAFVLAVVNGTPDPRVQLVRGNVERPARKSGGNAQTQLGLALVAAGLATHAAGAIVVKTQKSNPEGQQRETLYSKPGIGLEIAGSLVMAGGVYLWKRGSHASLRRTAPLVLATLGVLALDSGIILYVTDDDTPRPDGVLVNDSARHGIVLGGAGIVAVGIGGYWWWRSSKRPVVPRVSVGRDHAFAGFTVSF